LRYVTFGRTGISVSTVSMGCNRLGDPGTDQSQWPPLARGLLTGKFPVGKAIPPEQQWRRPTGDMLQRRLQQIEQLRFLEREGQTLGQAAIRCVLSHPAVHCAIPGARTTAQIESIAVAADGDLTTDELQRIRALQAAWSR
jgi:aryl-alcohol dehydrogenase-like predicted oxidoreductase